MSILEHLCALQTTNPAVLRYAPLTPQEADELIRANVAAVRVLPPEETAGLAEQCSGDMRPLYRMIADAIYRPDALPCDTVVRGPVHAIASDTLPNPDLVLPGRRFVLPK